MAPLSNAETIKELADLRSMVQRSLDKVKRMRSLRPSEKAMQCVAIERKLNALNTAIVAVNKGTDDGGSTGD